MNVIIFYDADGVLNEMYPAPGYTEQEVINLNVPPGTSVLVTDVVNLPDDYWRDAWETDLTFVTVNLDGAKEIALIDVRKIADATTGFIQRSFLLNEDAGGVTQDDVTNAYEQAKQDIENATQVPFIKSVVDTFKANYSVEEG